MSKPVGSIPPKSRFMLRWSPTKKLYAVLLVLVFVIVVASLAENPFGAYAAAYVSTALVIYGLIDLVRKLRGGRSVTRTIPVLASGIMTGLFMNIGMVLGWSIYLAFIVGQIFTVSLIVWLTSSDIDNR